MVTPDGGYLRCLGKGELQSVRRSLICRDIPVWQASIAYGTTPGAGYENSNCAHLPPRVPKCRLATSGISQFPG